MTWLWWREGAPCGPNLAVPGRVSRITETLCSSLLDVSWMSSPSTIPVHAVMRCTCPKDVDDVNHSQGVKKKGWWFGTGKKGWGFGGGWDQNKTGVKGRKMLELDNAGRPWGTYETTSSLLHSHICSCNSLTHARSNIAFERRGSFFLPCASAQDPALTDLSNTSLHRPMKVIGSTDLSQPLFPQRGYSLTEHACQDSWARSVHRSVPDDRLRRKHK